LNEGSGIREALHRHAAPDDTGYALLHSGEVPVRLGEMLDHETRRLGQIVDLWRDSLANGRPRRACLLLRLIDL